ncbi:MAG: type II secretion system inner membrane protein GspF [Deltaproteobacteria bacterium]|nr:type II secretion system inner membrane protein GspF [Deltaproteobacteria bacterium]
MPVFEYSALDGKGKKRTGIVDADSPFTARQKLRDDGLFPTGIKETAKTAEDGQSSKSIRIPGLFGGVKTRSVSIMTRQLATLAGAGMPLVTALEILVPQTDNPRLKKVMAQVKDCIVEGQSLAQALARHPKIFPSIYINMVRAGEASGALEIVLSRLADLFERQEASKLRVQKAMVYPVVMMFLGTAVMMVLMVYIVPSITAIFQEVDRALPTPTRILLGVSSAIRSFWWVMAAAIAAAAFMLNRARRTEKGRLYVDETILKIPILGGLVLKLAVARFSRTLGSLLANGVPMLAALEIVKAVVDNQVLRNMVAQASEKVGEGRGLGESLAAGGLFPVVAVQMMGVGEHSGALEAMLEKVADLYQGEAEAAIDSMTTLLEPVMILCMAVVVGFVVISILLPIFEMSQLAG